MVYMSQNAMAPAMAAGGPQSYQNPYYKTQCGCGTGRQQVTMMAGNVREGFNAQPQQQQQQMGGYPSQGYPAPGLQAGGGGAPLCTLTATAPPAGCCHPAPLHCDCCNGSGFFRASEAYGS